MVAIFILVLTYAYLKAHVTATPTLHDFLFPITSLFIPALVLSPTLNGRDKQPATAAASHFLFLQSIKALYDLGFPPLSSIMVAKFFIDDLLRSFGLPPQSPTGCRKFLSSIKGAGFSTW